MLAHAREQLVINVTIGPGDGVRIGECDALALIEQTAGFPVSGKRVELSIRDTEVAADGSIEVRSKFTAIDRCHAPVQDRGQSRIDQARFG